VVVSQSKKHLPEKLFEIWMIVFGLIGIIHASFLSSLLDKQLSKDQFSFYDGIEMILVGISVSFFMLVLAAHVMPDKGWRAQASRWLILTLALTFAVGSVGSFTDLWGKTIATFTSWVFSVEFFLALGVSIIGRMDVKDE
jgi:hypothetical protein